MDLDLEWEDLATGDDPDNQNGSGVGHQLNELEQALRYLNVTQQTEIFVNQTKPKKRVQEIPTMFRMKTFESY